MAASSLVTVETYTYPFAPVGTVEGFDFAQVDHALRVFPSWEGTTQLLEHCITASDEHAFVMRWNEPPPSPHRLGRMCRVTATMAKDPPDKNRVRINSCYVNGGRKRKGLARATLDFAALIAAPLDADITVCADDDGREAWLALGGQPDTDDHQSIVRKARRIGIDPKLVARLRERDYVGARDYDPDEFSRLITSRPAWDGGWSREQVREIATKVNEGLR